MDRAKKLYEQYQKDYEQNATQYREQAQRQGLDPRNVVQGYRSTTPGGGRTGTQAQPTSQGSTGTGGQAAAGPATFDRADFLTWRQSAGKTGNPTQDDVEAYFQAKGLKRR